MSSSLTSRPVVPRPMTWWLLPLLIGYAVLALLGGVLHRPALSLIAACLLLAALLTPVVRRPSVGGALLWLLAALLVLVPALAGRLQLVLAGLPILILGAMSMFFARTLLPGREPLISRCVRVIESDQRLALPGVARYTRGVTVYWACLLGAQAVVLTILLLCAQPGGVLDALGMSNAFAIPRSALAWYPEAGCWVVLVVAFAAEYAVRRWTLRRLPHPPLKRFLTRLVQRWPELLRDEVAQ